MISKDAHMLADDLYRNRQNISGVRESIDRLLNESECETDYGIQWRLSRSYFFLGQEEGEKSGKSTFFKRGIVSGEKSVSLAPDQVEGHFWLAVNQALMAEAVSNLSALGYIRSAFGHLERACEIDRRFHGAGPLRIKARLKHKLPWPLGSRKASECLYKEALSLCPDNSVTRIYYAELLHDLARTEEEQAQFKSIIGLPDDTEWNFELCRDKQIAAKRLGNDGPGF